MIDDVRLESDLPFTDPSLHIVTSGYNLHDLAGRLSGA